MFLILFAKKVCLKCIINAPLLRNVIIFTSFQLCPQLELLWTIRLEQIKTDGNTCCNSRYKPKHEHKEYWPENHCAYSMQDSTSTAWKQWALVDQYSNTNRCFYLSIMFRRTTRTLFEMWRLYCLHEILTIHILFRSQINTSHFHFKTTLVISNPSE